MKKKMNLSYTDNIKLQYVSQENSFFSNRISRCVRMCREIITVYSDNKYRNNVGGGGEMEILSVKHGELYTYHEALNV